MGYMDQMGYWHDPVLGIWKVNPGETPDTAAAHPKNLQWEDEFTGMPGPTPVANDPASRWSSYQNTLAQALQAPPTVDPNQMQQTLSPVQTSGTANVTANTSSPTTAAQSTTGYTNIPTAPGVFEPNTQTGQISYNMNKFQLRMKGPGPNDWKFSNDVAEIDKLLNEGWQPIGDEGNVLNVESFNGGTLIDGLPINTVLTGLMSPAQRTALINGGKWNPEWEPGGNLPIRIDENALNGSTGNTPPPTTGGGTDPTGGSNVNTSALPKDFSDMLRDLIDRSLKQGESGQKALGDVLSRLGDSSDFAKKIAGENYAKRNQLVDQMLGRVNPAIEQAIAGMNTGQGLSPEAKAALRVNAVESPEYAYQQQASQLKGLLGQRGAYGGETPGSLGDIVRGYAPLMTERDRTRSGLTADSILADEQRRFESLGLNRQTGLGAMNIGAGLTGTLGNIFDPSNAMSQGNQSLASLLNATNAYNQSGFQGLGGASSLAGILGDQQTGSFANLLKSSLLSTGLDIGSKLPWTDIFKSIAGIFAGGKAPRPPEPGQDDEF